MNNKEIKEKVLREAIKREILWVDDKGDVIMYPYVEAILDLTIEMKDKEFEVKVDKECQVCHKLTTVLISWPTKMTCIRCVAEIEREETKQKTIEKIEKIIDENKICDNCLTIAYGDGNCHCGKNNWTLVYLKELKKELSKDG